MKYYYLLLAFFPRMDAFRARQTVVRTIHQRCIPHWSELRVQRCSSMTSVCGGLLRFKSDLIQISRIFPSDMSCQISSDSSTRQEGLATNIHLLSMLAIIMYIVSSFRIYSASVSLLPSFSSVDSHRTVVSHHMKHTVLKN